MKKQIEKGVFEPSEGQIFFEHGYIEYIPRREDPKEEIDMAKKQKMFYED